MTETGTPRVPPEAVHCCPPGRSRGRELLHVDCASHIYPDGSVGIHGMCFRVFEGEIVALCGGNGAGKSTLIEHLNGLLQPSTGRILLDGVEIDGERRRDLWKTVGVVFQRPDDQLFAPTVREDIMFGLLNLGQSRDEAEKTASRTLEILGAADLAGKMPAYLSGGQKRLAAIAGVLAMRPRIMALDEPTSDLDPVHAEAIERIIRDLRSTHGISVVIATHDLDLAARLADRVCLVKEGSILAEGEPREIFYDGAVLARAGLPRPSVVSFFEELSRLAGASPDARPLTHQEILGWYREQVRR